MILSKANILLVILLSIFLSHQIGIKNIIYGLLSLLMGYSSASYLLKRNFRFPSYRKIEKKKINTNSLVNLNDNDIKPISKNLKGSISSSSLPSYKTNSNSLEHTFTRTFPWQSIHVPEVVDKSIEELLSKIIQNFVLVWYNKISVDDGLVYEVKSLFRHILANLILRIKQVDIKHFVTFTLNTILYNHLSDFSEFYSRKSFKDLKAADSLRDRIKIQFEIFKLINETVDKPQLHFALTSRKNELKYLRQVCKQILPHLLPQHILKCRISLELIEEIASSNLLLKGLDILADPDIVNQIFIKSIQSHKENNRITSQDNHQYVQILKHWCQMNGRIFKSILSPNFDEIIENNDLLHLFINYLNSTNSLSVLQLYLMLKDINKSFEQATNEFMNNPNINSQIEELKNWCEFNKKLLETIYFDQEIHYFEKISNFIATTASLNERDSSRKILKEINEALCDFIKDAYYNEFIKSEYMYKNLIGLNKINSKSHMVSNRKKKNVDNKAESDSVSIEEYETDELSLNENHFASNKNDIIDETILEDNDQDEFENFEFNVVENESVKPSAQVRLDLINEINDEFGEGNDLIISQTDTPKIEEHEEDENETDEDLETENKEINLSNLRVAIDEIEELVDRSNKTCYVFLIQVWTIEPKSMENSNDSLNDSTIWYVKRKYDEFYVLDTRLKEFHGELINNLEYNINNPNQITVQLPPKQRALYFLSNSKTFEYLNSVKNDFSKYLQSLLTNPILSMSQLIKSFLDPNSIEFSSSIFNDISNIGKMVKGVPYKLRVERGQSLDPFLISLLKSIKQQKPKNSSKKFVTKEDFTDKLLNNVLYNQSENNNRNIEIKKNKNIAPLEILVTPFESFLFLIKEIYRAPSWLALLIFSIKNLIQKSFDSFIYWTISKKIDDLTKPDAISNHIKLFKQLVFENDGKKESSEELYLMAFQLINELINEEFLSLVYKIPLIEKTKLKNAVDNGTKLFLESFQYPLLNKNLTYQLLDALIDEIFPELKKK